MACKPPVLALCTPSLFIKWASVLLVPFECGENPQSTSAKKVYNEQPLDWSAEPRGDYRRGVEQQLRRNSAIARLSSCGFSRLTMWSAPLSTTPLAFGIWPVIA
jgi:hypothetical protein